MKVPTRLATVALAAICFAAPAATASAATPTLVAPDYIVPPGKTITFSNMTIKSCNEDYVGVIWQQEWPLGGAEILGDNLASAPCDPVALAARSFTNDTTTDQRFHFLLSDTTCNRDYWWNDSHSLITPDRVLINDAGSTKKKGADCSKAATASLPSPKRGANFSAQVSID